MEKIKKLLKQILGLIEFVKMKSKMNRNKYLNGTYGQLNYIKYFSAPQFVLLTKYNDQCNERSIRNKEKIKIGFVLYTSSIWNVDELHNRLTNDSFYEVDLILVHLKVQDQESSEKMFNQTYEYFKKKNYSIKKASEINVSQYDVLFYLTIGYIEENNIRINNISTNIMTLYTSYSYMLSDAPSKLNAALYHISYCYYTDSVFYKNSIEQNKYYTGNAKYLGFPKMDQYYNAQFNRRSDKKIIIYAPHHSVHRSGKRTATFEDNYMSILALAEKYCDTTYWIFKPHPSLRSTSVAAGIFNSVEEYDEYESKWNMLNNADVMSVGDYFSAFKESDAMITDSVSFLAEYQFTHKPLLLLESGKGAYNDFGKSIVNILYSCSGTDIQGIETFINDVIAEKDEMKEKRLDFFKQNLEYNFDGISASEKIYNDIKSFSRKKE